MTNSHQFRTLLECKHCVVTVLLKILLLLTSNVEPCLGDFFVQ